jgi:hypothetical protein
MFVAIAGVLPDTGPREARIHVALFRWSPFRPPVPMAGVTVTRYDGLP